MLGVVVLLVACLLRNVVVRVLADSGQVLEQHLGLRLGTHQHGIVLLRRLSQHERRLAHQRHRLVLAIGIESLFDNVGDGVDGLPLQLAGLRDHLLHVRQVLHEARVALRVFRVLESLDLLPLLLDLGLHLIDVLLQLQLELLVLAEFGDQL